MKIFRVEIIWHPSKKRQKVLDAVLNEYMSKMPVSYALTKKTKESK